jgi:hypothetical protein
MNTIICPKCGTENPANTMNCKNCRVNLKFALEHFGQLESAEQEATQPEGEEKVSPDVPQGAESSRVSRVRSLRTRYADAYAVAHSAVSLGHIVQVVGIVTGILLLLFALSMASSIRLGTGGMIGGMILACAVAVLIYGSGTRIAAQGQSLLASLDSAVNSSPFLSDNQKADILGI